MPEKYLDLTGLSHFLEKLDNRYVDKTTNQEIDGTKIFLERPQSMDEYTKIEYIDSSNATDTSFPYIRTGVKRGVTYTTSEVLSCILDGYFTTSQTLAFCGYDSGGQLGQSSGKWSTESGTSNVSALTRTTVTQVFNVPSSYDRLYVNGTQIANRTVNSAGTYATAADYPLFVAYNGTAFAYKPAKLRMYSFKMYIGDASQSTSGCTLIRDFIPVKDSHGTVGLFDLVENKFYTSANNISFNGGEELSPTQTIEMTSQLLTSGDVSKVGLTNNYNDLDNKPTIPTVSNSTITIKQTGISDQTFTLNGSAKTITLVDTNTWRNIKVNGTELLGSAISTGAVNFKNGSNVTITGSGNDITISSSYTDTNQKVKAGSVTFGNNDVIDFVAGDNVTITGLASGTGAPKITITATDTDTGATSVEITGSGNVVNSASYDAATRKLTLSKGITALTSHQSIKTLKTDNTTAQSTSSSETITGSGTINLHKIAKTGSYNDLLDKPTIPSNYVTLDTNQTITGQKTFTSSLNVNYNNEHGSGLEATYAGDSITVKYGDTDYKTYVFPSDNGGTFAMTSDLPQVKRYI